MYTIKCPSGNNVEGGMLEIFLPTGKHVAGIIYSVICKHGRENN